MAEPILLARRDDVECLLLPALANRHGLVTGATGTGKTITLQTLAENFSRRGVPVFLADVKGDLTGISQAGSVSPKLAATLKERGIDAPSRWPAPHAVGRVRRAGPSRCATISDMGRCCSAACSRSTRRSGRAPLVFKVADDNGLLLLDLKDLRAMLQHVGDNASASPPSTATSAQPASARSSAACCSSASRAATNSSASRCSTSPT